MASKKKNLKLSSLATFLGLGSLAIGILLSAINIYIAIGSAEQKRIDAEKLRPRFQAQFFTVFGDNKEGADIDNLLGVIAGWTVEERQKHFRNHPALSSPVVRNEILDYVQDAGKKHYAIVVDEFLSSPNYCQEDVNCEDTDPNCIRQTCDHLHCATTFVYLQNIGVHPAHNVVIDTVYRVSTPENPLPGPTPLEYISGDLQDLPKRQFKVGEIGPNKGVLLPLYCEISLENTWPPFGTAVGLVLKPLTVRSRDPFTKKEYEDSIRKALETAVEISYGVSIRG